MAYSTISKPSLYFNTKLYTGDGTSSNSITGVGFAPDFVWSKARNGANAHILVDKVRGATKVLHSSATTAEQTCNANQDMISLDSDGFTVGTPTQFLGTNTNGRTVASWNWKANSAGSANTDGSINSTVSVNTTAGFSIVSWTANGSNATIGHGLGSVPKMILLKCRTQGDKWIVYNSKIGNTKYLVLNATDAETTSSTHFNNTSPTSSVFSTGTSGNVSGTGETFIAYCFAEKKGYSKFGTYKGNGNANGSFIYTGFKPAFIMQKKTSGTSDWVIYDNKRDVSNVVTQELKPNSNGAESSNTNIDILSNGFKQRANYAYTNNSGGTYIYMAFAAEPLVANVGNSIPATAR